MSDEPLADDELAEIERLLDLFERPDSWKHFAPTAGKPDAASMFHQKCRELLGLLRRYRANLPR